MYTPSEDMIKAGTTKGLVDYMQKVEPNAIIRAPDGYVIDGKEIKPISKYNNEVLGNISQNR